MLIILGGTLCTAIVYTLIELAIGRVGDDDFSLPEQSAYDDPDSAHFND
ncbi:hypothetical protein DFP92_108135 [Yoonia sediminilitoris]|uniref:Uncharacterized protein n=2 Tax=Yoonia sediminilitoris TaxID=1286148 RepID=A0A2T6KDX1_9RHOB|nr:hypothetical protein C8N45_108134 [Yoonia sediminilitoris]RCW94548.1 hypothetical protein DFP92_108135 [Yoonia sediminilitoris]